MGALWRIRLLGELSAEGPGRSVARFRTQKTAGLLAYLALHRHRAHRRELLIDLLWPESGLDSGRHSLSLALSSLRHALRISADSPDAVFLANRSTVQLNPDTVTTDVAEWEAALQGASAAGSVAERTGLLAAALELYRGPLLPGTYETWFHADQQRLADQFFRAARELILLLEGTGDVSKALDCALNATRLDPLREAAHGEVMRILLAAGDPSGALRQFEQLERVLRDQLGSVPSAELRSLAAEIRAGSASREAAPTHPRGVNRTSHTITYLLIDTVGTGELTCFRESVSGHRGIELQADGAALAATFSSASEALACAVAGQMELRRTTADLPGPARLAMHSGDVPARDSGDDAGTPLRVAEAVLRATREGQFLCCEATAALLYPRITPEVRLLNLGVYRLSGIERPERLFRVEHRELSGGEAVDPRAECLSD